MKTLLQDWKLFAALFCALLWCAILIIFRALWTRSFDYAFLFWNLGLACAPLFFSSLVVLQRGLSLRLLFGCLWLLFLPNAPYIITDFIHLRVLDSGPIWLYILMLGTCAATGLALAYYSMLQIQQLLDSSGKAVFGWMLAFAGMFLCGLGIYLGRFLRWRSVDLFTDPLRLVFDITERVTDPLVHYRAWGVTLGFGIMLSVGYLVATQALTRPRPRLDSKP